MVDYHSILPSELMRTHRHLGSTDLEQQHLQPVDLWRLQQQ